MPLTIVTFGRAGLKPACYTEEVPVPTALPQDVHLVVSDTARGITWAKPSAIRLKTPHVFKIWPGTHHGGGLLPLDHTNGYFVVCSVFTSLKGCQCQLKATKVASAFDIPHQLVYI
jgi:hypothetical protein